MRAIPLELRKVAAVLGIALVLGASFVAAYTIALGRPVPRHLPVGIVGDASSQLLAELQQRSQEFEPHRYPTRDAAVQAVDRQEITAVIDTTAIPPQLLISSASDPSSARVLTQIEQAGGPPALEIVDLNPLPAADPAGLATFYLIIAATILGFVTMFQLRANVKTLTLGRWLGCLAVLAVVGGATLAAVAGLVLGALSTPFPVLWALVSAQIGVAAMFNSAMLVMIHRWAIIPTWLVFILLGNTSSGGAVSATLLPQPFSVLNHALPSGAAVSAIHSATYFPDYQRPGPYLVLAVWLVASTVVLVVASRRLKRSPAQA
ncbi:membrane protein [Mycolicibacterium rufum]|nr:membrane protein [Mycolicibacterium rufum]